MHPSDKPSGAHRLKGNLRGAKHSEPTGEGGASRQAPTGHYSGAAVSGVGVTRGKLKHQAELGHTDSRDWRKMRCRSEGGEGSILEAIPLRRSQ